MTDIDLIKDKLNILDVVSSYVKLEKAGGSYKGRSPFTSEKTPSFFVSPEKGFFYCFSSGKGGDIFTFIQEIEKISFKEALVLLAERANVSLSSGKQSQESTNKKTKLYKLIDEVSRWYSIQLSQNKEALQYLSERGLNRETVQAFRLGFAPDAWTSAYDFLKQKNYHDEEIYASGMSTKKQGGTSFYDRFRSRIMFPLFDSQGRIVGFSGRIFPGEKDEKNAKYVNSPESVLFHKSDVLYGFHTAKKEITKKDFCILVEGQFDAILSQQVGFANTVAISGTGLTKNHLEQLLRFSNNLYLALDADSAGIQATKRSVSLAYSMGASVSIITLPQGEDPASIIKKSKELWEVAIRDAKNYIDYRLELLEFSEQLSFEEKRKVIYEDIFSFLGFVQSAITRDKYLQKIALFLGVDVDSVRLDFSDFFSQEKEEFLPQEKENEKIMRHKEKESPKEQILSKYIFLRELGVDIQEDFLKKISNLYSQLFQSKLEEDFSAVDQTKKNIDFFVLSEKYHLNQNPRDILESLLHDLYIQRIFEIEKHIDENNKFIKKAELRKDIDTVRSLLQATQDLSAEKRELQNHLNHH